MGELAEFSAAVRIFLRAYPWRRIDPIPWTPLARPLAACRLGLVSSAGLCLPDQEPFDDSIRGGDVSFREIPSDADPRTLAEWHRSDTFDHAGVRSDANLVLPMEPARELVRRGRVASLAARHLSFMGSITAPRRLVRDTAPRAAESFVEQQVDVALLVPV